MKQGSFAGDIAASFVVFLVAVPLSLGIAVASGAPVQAGLIAAVVGGIVVGLFGGAPFQVSGPAAGLTVMVYGFVQQFGFKTVGVIVVLAGLMQVAMGIGRLAKVALAVSPAVLHAMLAGIGILITLGQLQVIFGSTPKGSAWLNVSALPALVAAPNTSALAVGLVTFGALVSWAKWVAPHFKLIPGSLVAVILGTVVSFIVPGDISRVSIGSDLLAGFALPSLGEHTLGSVMSAALALTIVASAESLLCAVATDQLHTGKRANLDRELLAQGLGNTLCGLVGGLPITGVIVRSSANIASGATTRLSAILHGVWVALFVVLGSGLLTKLPLAALAALLVHVGINLVKMKEAKRIIGFGEGSVYFVTVAGVVFINLLWGIGIGFALALFFQLRPLTTLEVELKTKGDELDVTLGGRLSFLAVPALTDWLRRVPEGKTVHLHFRFTQIDQAAIEAIRAWAEPYERAGGRIVKAPLEDAWRELTRTRIAVK